MGRSWLGKPKLMPCLIDSNILIHAVTGDADAPILSRIDNAIADKARYSVVTRNSGDFMRIPGLVLIAPFAA